MGGAATYERAITGAPRVAPALQPPRFPHVDGLRALAALLILTFHASFYTGAFGPSFGGRVLAHMNVGVAVFFLLSGFLLYRPFIAWRSEGAEPPPVTRYLRHRFLRIFPAYWLLVTVLVLLPGTTAIVGGDWVPTYGIVEPLPLGQRFGCSDTPFSCGVGHTWSLTVELTFYLALPLYVLAMRGLARGRRWAEAELATLGVLAVVSIVIAYGDESAPRAVALSALAFGLWFGLGMALAVVSVARWMPSIPRARWWWGTAAALYVTLIYALPATPLLATPQDRLVQHVAFGAVALLVLAPVVLGNRGGMILGDRRVRWLGVVSYGVFLWHYVIAEKLSGIGWSFAPVWLATMALVVPVAALSYYLLERPVLRWLRES